MYPSLKTCLLAGLIFCLAVSTSTMAENAEPKSETAKTAQLLNYARIYTGTDNETHFEDVSVTFTHQGDYGKNIPSVWLSQGGLMKVEGLHFVSMAAGWDGGEWHPTPARQYIIPLTGEMEFQTSDGEKRTFGPGDILLVEDTEGKGHISKMVSSSIGVFAVIPVPE